MRKKRAVAVQKGRGNTAKNISKNRVYCIVFMKGLNSYDNEKNREYVELVRKIFKREEYERTCGDSGSLFPSMRHYALFVPTGSLPQLEGDLKKVTNAFKTEYFMPKIEKSTKEEVKNLFQGKKTLRLKVQEGWTSIFKFMFDNCLLYGYRPVEDEYVDVKTGEKTKHRSAIPESWFRYKERNALVGKDMKVITIKGISKEGIKYFKDVKAFLEGAGEQKTKKQEQLPYDPVQPMLPYYQ